MKVSEGGDVWFWKFHKSAYTHISLWKTSRHSHKFACIHMYMKVSECGDVWFWKSHKSAYTHISLWKTNSKLLVSMLGVPKLLWSPSCPASSKARFFCGMVRSENFERTEALTVADARTWARTHIASNWQLTSLVLHVFICTGSICWERSGWGQIHIPCYDQVKVCIWIWHK